MTGKRDQRGYVQAYTWDEAGQRTRLVDPNGGVTTFAFDLNGRVSSHTDPEGNVTTLAYDSRGSQTTMVYASGVQQISAYDVDGRLTTQLAGLSGDFGQIYTLDANGNRTGTTEVYGTYAGAVSTFTYDAKDRLTQDATSAPLAHTYTYTYDSRDNILTNSESGGVVQMNYDVASRLTTSTAGGVTTTYTFDSSGNLTGVNEAGTLTTMVYDKENRLKEHKQGAPGSETAFTYDLNSLKQSETFSNATNQLVWDGADMLGEVPAVKPVGAPLMPTRYNMAQGILFATTRFEPAATRTDTGADFIGSILTDFDENGDYVAERRYKPHGELLAGTATTYGWTGNTGSRATLLQYAEQYNRRRHVSTKLKQWTTRDPLWPDESAYGYVRGGPLTWTDPSGLNGNIPNCCINNKPGVLVGARCVALSRFSLSGDPLEGCYLQRCSMCSSGQNDGFESVFQTIVDKLTTSGNIFDCGRLRDCIGDCPNEISVPIGAQLHFGGHGFSTLIGAGCCIQAQIDLQCLFFSIRRWAQVTACRPELCKHRWSRRPDLDWDFLFWAFWTNRRHCLNTIIRSVFGGGNPIAYLTPWGPGSDRGKMNEY